MYILRTVIAAVICLAAAIFDYKTTKIPNKFIFPVIILSLIFSLIFYPLISTGTSVLFVLLLFLYGMTGWMGLGDIKLLMALTFIGSWKMSLFTLVLSSIYLMIFGFLANPTETGFYMRKMLNRFRLKKEPLYKKSTKYKFAPFILLGALSYSVFFDPSGPFHFELFGGIV